MRFLVFIAVGICLTLEVTESDSRFGNFDFSELGHMRYEVYISPEPKSEREAYSEEVGDCIAALNVTG